MKYTRHNVQYLYLSLYVVTVVTLILTIAVDILKVFNPDIYGFSTGSGGRRSRGANLNIATSGAEARLVVDQYFDSYFQHS